MMENVDGTDEYLYELAAVYQYAGQTDTAIKTYNRAEQALGINEVSSIQKLRLFLEAGRTQEGLAEEEADESLSWRGAVCNGIFGNDFQRRE